MRWCGESVAVLTYHCDGSIPDRIRNDLKTRIGIDAQTSVYLIYRDPDTKEWQTADVYLSGNVREKLNGDAPVLAKLERLQPM